VILPLEVILESDSSVLRVPAIHAVPSLVLLSIRHGSVQLRIRQRLGEGDPLAVFVDCAIPIFVGCKAFPDFLVVLGVIMGIGMIPVIMTLPTLLDWLRTLIESINPAFLNHSHEWEQ